jgi:hypothetical protein
VSGRLASSSLMCVAATPGETAASLLSPVAPAAPTIGAAGRGSYRALLDRDLVIVIWRVVAGPRALRDAPTRIWIM